MGNPRVSGKPIWVVVVVVVVGVTSCLVGELWAHAQDISSFSWLSCSSDASFLSISVTRCGVCGCPGSGRGFRPGGNLS
jgi:hypothetical protein